ncbi:MAG TPA: DUF72 domain-containing protein [Gammaproteobacteria bacterium]
MPSAAIHIGTSGWSYEHRKGTFYPEDLGSRDMLGHYAQRLRSVEINSSFYRLPDRATFEHWRDAVPDGFVFSTKASRYITHMKKLKNPTASVRRFFTRVGALGHTLGPILFQLPPRRSFHERRLVDFLDHLPAKYRYAFEFRDPTWLNDRAFAALRRHNAALCIYDLAGFRSPLEITAGFVYLRLHGPGTAYACRYETHALARWAKRISTWSESGRTVYCYFDNDERGYAVDNALCLRAML